MIYTCILCNYETNIKGDFIHHIRSKQHIEKLHK